jgi:hypothetical protein
MGKAEDWVLLAARGYGSVQAGVVLTALIAGTALASLAVGRLGDGLVALPADPRTREQLEWVAEEVTEHGGEATVWLGRPLDTAARGGIVARMTAAVAAEYDAVAAEAAAVCTADSTAQRRAATRLRRELHRIQDRDFFTCPQREAARRAVESLAATDPAGART